MIRFWKTHAITILTASTVFLVLIGAWHLLAWRASQRLAVTTSTTITLRRLRLHAFELERLTTAIKNPTAKTGDLQRQRDMLQIQISEKSQTLPPLNPETELPALSDNQKQRTLDTYNQQKTVYTQLQATSSAGESPVQNQLHDIIRAYAAIEAEIK